MKLKILGPLLIFTAFSHQSFAGEDRYQPSADAIATYLSQHPDADLAKVQEDLMYLDVEIEALKQAVLTDAGQSVFFPGKLPYVPGELVVAFGDKTQKLLEPKFENGKIDLTVPTGIGEFDSLNERFGATKLTKGNHPRAGWRLALNDRFNMIRVAKLYHGLEITKYAEKVGGGATQPAAYIGRNEGSRQALYTFHVGWDDCPAGCINQYRKYVEVDVLGPVNLVQGKLPELRVIERRELDWFAASVPEVTVLYEVVGDAGSELSAEVREQFFH